MMLVLMAVNLPSAANRIAKEILSGIETRVETENKLFLFPDG